METIFHYGNLYSEMSKNRTDILQIAFMSPYASNEEEFRRNELGEKTVNNANVFVTALNDDIDPDGLEMQSLVSTTCIHLKDAIIHYLASMDKEQRKEEIDQSMISDDESMKLVRFVVTVWSAGDGHTALEYTLGWAFPDEVNNRQALMLMRNYLESFERQGFKYNLVIPSLS